MTRKSRQSPVPYTFCAVEEGTPENLRSWNEIKQYTGDIPQSIKDVALTASAFGTTLWFDKKDSTCAENEKMVNQLIACGQFTACFMVLAHLIVENQEDLTALVQDDLYKESLKLWDQFKANPFVLLVEELGIEIA